MLRMEEAMIKEVYNYLLKLNSGILVIIIMAFIIMLIMAKPHLIKALKENHILISILNLKAKIYDKLQIASREYIITNWLYLKNVRLTKNQSV